VYAEVPAGKPDVGYDYEGPIEDMPRNLTPAIVIAGMPDAKISGVVLENVAIKFAGGGNPFFAKIGLDELDKVPERANAYPDFSMFKELPAWGAYIRHAEKIEFRNVQLNCEKKDYRPAIVLDDVHASKFGGGHVTEPAAGKKQTVYQYKSSDIVVK
jgi:hypothetical protein